MRFCERYLTTASALENDETIIPKMISLCLCASVVIGVFDK